MGSNSWMDDEGLVCDTCGVEWPLDRYNLTCADPETCFKCRARSVGTSFQGSLPDSTRGFWHDTTMNESIREITQGFKERNGVDPVPATKTYYGPATV